MAGPRSLEMLAHFETRGNPGRPPDPAIVAKLDELIAKFGEGVIKRETVVKWNYDIELGVEPFKGKTRWEPIGESGRHRPSRHSVRSWRGAVLGWPGRT